MEINSINLSEIFEKYGTAPAILSDKRSLTYGELTGAIIYTAGILAENGLRSGDRVAIISNPDADYIVTLFALWKIGAVAAPVSPRFPAGRINEMLSLIDCRTVICSDENKKLVQGMPVRVLDTSKWRIINNTDENDISLPLDQDATIIFTSGSSGNPKAVLHSLSNHYFSAIGSNKNISLSIGHRWLLSLPLYHIGGLAILFRVFLAGATVVVLKNQAALAESVERFNITHISLVGTQLYRLLMSQISLKSCRQLIAVLLGGGKVPRSLLESAQKHGLPVHTSYGCTEMASQITTTAPDDFQTVLKSAGKILDYRELTISDDSEILVRGRTLFRGYVEGESIKTRCNGDGWFPTGDMGSIDPHGYLTVEGRRDHMFISGGENIFPEEIEQALNTIDDVIESLVVAIPNKEFGECPAAFLRTIDATLPDQRILSDKLAEFLPRFKIPKFFFEWPAEADNLLKPDRKKFSRLACEIVATD